MLQDRLDDVVRTLRDGEKLVKDILGRLEREAALSAVGHLIDELKNKYRDSERITAYLEDVKEDILAHLDDFKTAEEQTPVLPFMRMPKTEPTFTRYIVNVLVNNKETKARRAYSRATRHISISLEG